MRWAIASLLVVFVAATVGLVIVAGRSGELSWDDLRVPEPSGAWPTPDVPKTLESVKRVLRTESERSIPSAEGSKATPGWVEIGPDGGITITNVPDAATPSRIVREPDGDVVITNRPRDGRARAKPGAD